VSRSCPAGRPDQKGIAVRDSVAPAPLTIYLVQKDGPCEARCNYGFGVSIRSPGELLKNDGGIAFSKTSVGFTKW